jgi:tellurite resistance protein
MDLKNFTDPQRRAVLDLAVLAMYSDGHLSTAEHERVERILAAMGLPSDWQRSVEYDAAVSRVSRHSGSLEAARAHALTLARRFDAPEQRKLVHALLHDLVASDGKLSPQETAFLSTVREALQL